MCTNLSKTIDAGVRLRDLKCILEANIEMHYTPLSSGTALKFT
jgi:hypothetical protein